MSMQSSEKVPQIQPALCKDPREADMSNVKTTPNIKLVGPEENAEDDFLPDITAGEHNYKSDDSPHSSFFPKKKKL